MLRTAADTSAALTSLASLARAFGHQETTCHGLQRQAQVLCGVSPTGFESRSILKIKADWWSDHGRKSLRANPAVVRARHVRAYGGDKRIPIGKLGVFGSEELQQNTIIALCDAADPFQCWQTLAKGAKDAPAA